MFFLREDTHCSCYSCVPAILGDVQGIQILKFNLFHFHLAIASPAPSSARVTRAVSPGKPVLPSPTSTQELGTGISNASCIAIMIRE